MALLPHLLNDILYDRYDPVSRLLDQDFGVGVLNDDLYRPSVNYLAPILAGYVRPHRHVSPDDSGVSTVSQEKDTFKVNLDVQQFKPEEISVKVVDDYIVVDGKHEERQDKHGFISRQFTRKYKLPPNVNLESIKSNLSSDGILSIVAPKKAIEAGPSRSIPVVQTNQPAIKQSKKQAGSGDNDKMET